MEEPPVLKQFSVTFSKKKRKESKPRPYTLTLTLSQRERGKVLNGSLCSLPAFGIYSSTSQNDRDR
jgi:hypothetical protein